MPQFLTTYVLSSHCVGCPWTTSGPGPVSLVTIVHKPTLSNLLYISKYRTSRSLDTARKIQSNPTLLNSDSNGKEYDDKVDDLLKEVNEVKIPSRSRSESVSRTQKRKLANQDQELRKSQRLRNHSASREQQNKEYDDDETF